MSPADMRRLAFGAGDKKHRTRRDVEDAFRRLPGVVVLDERATNPRTGEVGWIVVPAAAAARMRHEGDDDGE